MWGATIEHAAILGATARAIRADSLMLKVHAQKVRRARPVSGGSDLGETTLAGLIISVILERPTCLTCVSAKVGANRACGSTLGPVFSVERAK
jgi:hypothetical protein